MLATRLALGCAILLIALPSTLLAQDDRSLSAVAQRRVASAVAKMPLERLAAQMLIVGSPADVNNYIANEKLDRLAELGVGGIFLNTKEV